MDNFLEEVATKRNKGSQTIAYIFANVLMILSGIWAFITLQVLMLAFQGNMGTGEIIYNVVLFLATACITVLLFLNRDKIKTEYEYTFTNGTMDFAQVYNNKKRKNLGTMNIKNVEAMGLVNSGSFNRYINMPGVKRHNWFANRDGNLFYIYYEKDQARNIIIMEPSQEMIDLIRGAVPQGSFQIN